MSWQTTSQSVVRKTEHGVDGGEDYEVGYLMKKHHLERADALRLVKKYGINRAKIEEDLVARKV